MPARRRSLQLSDAYRVRLLSLSDRAQRSAQAWWPSIEEFDRTDFAARMSRELTRLQTSAVRLSAGFLTAYLRSETGAGTALVIDSRRYAGQSRAGQALDEALASPLVAVRVSLKRGRTPQEALSIGLAKAQRLAGFEAVQAGRDALLDAIEADEHFDGWQRKVAGTCAACSALSGTGGPRFEVHPGCQCVPVPTVRGVVQRIAIPTGAALFAAKTREEQDASVGPEAAELIREGKATLEDFVAHSHTAAYDDDFITQAPAQDAA